tara:strand:- start:2269 stop:2865 length:597 start_codon:yes stop_codon:yes gene_type:complete
METQIKKHYITEIVKYLGKQGIVVHPADLEKEIPAFTQAKSSSTKTIRLVRKKKKTPKFNLVRFTYSDFVTICKKNSIQYFPFNDINNWSGPAINSSKERLEEILELFKKRDIHLVERGDGEFTIIRPKHLEEDKTEYPKVVFSEDDSDEDEIDYDNWEKWKYNGAFYWLDTETDYIYCYETEKKLGRKIDNYQAEFY